MSDTDKYKRISARDAVIHVIKSDPESLWTFMEDMASDFGLEPYDVKLDDIVAADRIKAYSICSWICTDEIAGFFAIYFEDRPAAFCFREGRKFDWKFRYFDDEVAKELFDYFKSFIREKKSDGFDLLEDSDHIEVYQTICQGRYENKNYIIEDVEQRILIDLSDEKLVETGLVVKDDDG